MADVKWIKIVTDVFDNRKIKQIESMPDADSILVIWFKILCLAGNINESGLLIITQDIPYTDEMLANEFKRPLNTIRMALGVFQQFGMIEVFDNVFCVGNWEKYQNVDGMDKIREQTRLRVAKHREKKRLELAERGRNATVTQGNATDISISISNSNSHSNSKESMLCGDDSADNEKPNKKSLPFKEIIEYLNAKAGTNYRHTTKATQSHINARLNEGFTENDFYAVIDKKVAEWSGTEQERYLRPETLFGTKFEGYLNQKIVNKKSSNPFLDMAKEMEHAEKGNSEVAGLPPPDVSDRDR